MSVKHILVILLSAMGLFACGGGSSESSNPGQQLGVSPSPIEPGAPRNGDDHGDGAFHATSLTLGQRIEGQINRQVDVDVFEVMLDAGLRVTLLGERLGIEQLTLTVEGAEGFGRRLFVANGAFDTTTFTAPLSGSYVLRVRGRRSDSGDGRYALTISRAIRNDDHADVAQAASTLVLGEAQSGSIEDKGDRDYFSCDLEKDVTYAFALASENGSADGILFNADGQIVRTVETFFNGTDAVRYTASETTTHFIEVSESNRDDQTNYSLRCSRVFLPDDHGNAPANATIIQANSRTSGDIEERGDVDVFRVELSAESRYVIELRDFLQSRVTAVIDFNDGNFRTFGEGLLGSIPFTPAVDGEHVITVQRSGRVATGSYTLEVIETAVRDDYTDSPTRPISIQLDAPTFGQIEQRNDIDFLTFVTVPNTRYTLRLGTGADANRTINARVSLLETGDFVFVEGSSDDVASVTFTAPTAGSALIEVSSDGTGSYSVTIEEESAPDDHGDFPTTATPVQAQTATRGVVDIAGEADWFSIDLIEGQEYRLAITEISGEVLLSSTSQIFPFFNLPVDGTQTLNFIADRTTTDLYRITIDPTSIQAEYELRLEAVR